MCEREKGSLLQCLQSDLVVVGGGDVVLAATLESMWFEELAMSLFLQ